MQSYILWSTDPVGGFVPFDTAAWNSLPKKNVPEGGEVIDALPGWPYAIIGPGYVIKGKDHYAIIPSTLGGRAGVFYATWDDDPEDWTPAEFYAKLYFIPDPPVARDGNGVWNTVGWRNQFYKNPTDPRPGYKPGDDLPVERDFDIFNWSDFAPPGQTRKISDLNANQLKSLYNNRPEIRHGITLDQTLTDAHELVIDQNKHLAHYKNWIPQG